MPATETRAPRTLPHATTRTPGHSCPAQLRTAGHGTRGLPELMGNSRPGGELREGVHSPSPCLSPFLPDGSSLAGPCTQVASSWRVAESDLSVSGNAREGGSLAATRGTSIFRRISEVDFCAESPLPWSP